MQLQCSCSCHYVHSPVYFTREIIKTKIKINKNNMIPLSCLFGQTRKEKHHIELWSSANFRFLTMACNDKRKLPSVTRGTSSRDERSTRRPPRFPLLIWFLRWENASSGATFLLNINWNSATTLPLLGTKERSKLRIIFGVSIYNHKTFN